MVLDVGSFESWDTPIDITHHPEQYRLELMRATERSGVDESVITGRGSVNGRPVAVVVNEFRFLGGSIGRASAARIVAAVERATSEGLPLLATTASGGTRMQEGTPAFVKMIDISRAVMRHRRAGLPYLVYLRHPTTGGVFASWGSLSQITVAEPDALIGFLGPKVYETLNGQPFPDGIQVSENLLRQGIIDGVVPAEDLAHLVDATLSILLDGATPPKLIRRDLEPEWKRTTWESITATREEGRAGLRDLLEHGADGTIRLRGTGKGERASAITVALTRLDGQPCVVIGQDRVAQSGVYPLGPGSLREARRGMTLANELGIPLVAVIDTPGAELSADAENGALAGEIARCIGTMSTMTVPVVSVLLGQGCGGGALALLPADHVIACETSWLAPLPPEGASAIVYGDASHAADLAESQGVSARQLLVSGIVNTVIAESPGDSALSLSQAVAAECAEQLRRLTSRQPAPRAATSSPPTTEGLAPLPQRRA